MELLELAKLSAVDAAIARVITDAINDDGYLKDSLEDIRLSLLPEIEASAGDVERVLAVVQSLEPAGVGARNLGECIALQLERSGDGLGAGAFLSPAPRRRRESVPGRVRHSRRIRAPHRTWVDRG